MAYNNDSAFSGTLYLLDAHNSRQYILEYRDGNAENVTLGGAHNADDQVLNAGEVIWAFDERAEFGLANDGSQTALTTAYAIKVDSRGNFVRTWNVPVEYNLEIKTQETGAVLLDGTLTFEAAQELERLKELKLTNDDYKDIEFDRFPTKINTLVDRKRLDDAAKKSENVLLQRHPKGANLARERDKERKSRLPAVIQPSGEQSKMQNQYNTSAQKKLKHTDRDVEVALASFGLDLTQKAEEGELSPVIGCEADVRKAITMMSRLKQSSLCFTGETSSGKTSRAEKLAQLIADEKKLPEKDRTLPKDMQNARIIRLDFTDMIAGTKYRGDFEKKLQVLTKGLQERKGMLNGQRIILNIEEVHQQLGMNGGGGGGNDIGNMLKDFLTSKGISAICTTTIDEYRKYIEPDKALARRIPSVPITSSTEEETIKILKGVWPEFKAGHDIMADLSDNDMAYIVSMTTRYNPQAAQPGKAVNALDMAGANAKCAGRYTIERQDILLAISEMSNLPVDYLNQDDSERVLKLEEMLPKEVLGQPGLEGIIKRLSGAHGGLSNGKRRPKACFALLGPTGVGKTETARAVARIMFGTEDAMIKIDMSQYSEKFAVSGLIGPPPGYVGYDAEPALTQVRKRPYCVLLLDEIEKAHPDVYNILLAILEDGKITDSSGRTILFDNVIIFMTSNIGSAEVAKELTPGKGMGLDDENDPAVNMTPEKMAAIYNDKLKKENGGVFPPELIGRIKPLGGIIPFVPLQKDSIATLVHREIEGVNKMLSSPVGTNLPGATLGVSENVLTQLMKEGYNPAEGARPLQGAVLKNISDALGAWITKNRALIKNFIAENGGVVIKIDSIDGEFSPVLKKPGANDNSNIDKTKKRQKDMKPA